MSRFLVLEIIESEDAIGGFMHEPVASFETYEEAEEFVDEQDDPSMFEIEDQEVDLEDDEDDYYGDEDELVFDDDAGADYN